MVVLKYVTKNGMRIRNAARQALLGHQTTNKQQAKLTPSR